MLKFIFSKTFLINLLIILIVITIAIWGIFKYLDSYTLNSQTISVPSLEGLTITEVEEILTEKKLQSIEKVKQRFLWDKIILDTISKI